MKKIVGVIKWSLADIGNALRFGFLFCLFFNASILLPCPLDAAASPRNSKEIVTFVKLFNFRQTRFPYFSSLNFVIVNVLPDKLKTVNESGLGANMMRIPEQNQSNKNNEQGTEKTGDNCGVAYHIKIISQFLLGCGIDMVIGFFISYLGQEFRSYFPPRMVEEAPYSIMLLS